MTHVAFIGFPIGRWHRSRYCSLFRVYLHNMTLKFQTTKMKLEK